MTSQINAEKMELVKTKWELTMSNMKDCKHEIYKKNIEFLMNNEALIIEIIHDINQGKINRNDVPEKLLNLIKIGSDSHELEESNFHTLKSMCCNF